jgi:hypothetical protein
MKIRADLHDGQINMRKSRHAGDARAPIGQKSRVLGKAEFASSFRLIEDPTSDFKKNC